MEITGGGTDINDPIEQRRHFVQQRERQEPGAIENPHEHDEEFVRALEYGMLTASGSGLGVDRLMMILSGAKTLRDVILFPSMREAPGEAPPRTSSRYRGSSICTSRSGSCSTWSVRVVDAELALDQLGELEPGAVAVGVGLDRDVGGEGGELRGDLPDVQVVDLDDARLLGHRAADPVGVDALRRGLEEDAAGVAQQAVGGVEHQARRRAARRSRRRGRSR